MGVPGKETFRAMAALAMGILHILCTPQHDGGRTPVLKDDMGHSSLLMSIC